MMYHYHHVKFPNFNFSRDFWLLISTGIMPISFENVVTSNTLLKDIKAANLFLDEYFPAFITGVSSCLRPTIQLLLNVLKSFNASFYAFLENDKIENRYFFLNF